MTKAEWQHKVQSETFTKGLGKSLVQHQRSMSSVAPCTRSPATYLMNWLLTTKRVIGTLWIRQRNTAFLGITSTFEIYTTVHLERIHSAPLLPQFVMIQPYSEIDQIHKSEPSNLLRHLWQQLPVRRVTMTKLQSYLSSVLVLLEILTFTTMIFTQDNLIIVYWCCCN